MNTSSCPQDLEVELRKLKQALEDERFGQKDGAVHVPTHLVNMKVGNKHEVLLPGRSSFGPISMARIVAKAGLFRGEEGADAATRVDQDEFYLMKLQHNKVDRGMPTLQRLACFNP
jgi:hypothetical protein